jgi:hypothetical protein
MVVFVCRRALVCVLIAFAFCLVVSPIASAATAVVTPPGTTACKSFASYPTISLAVSSVPAGSTIYICPGTYAEQVVINKNLTLTGEAGNGSSGPSASGGNNPVIVSPSGGVAVNTNDLAGYPSGQPTAAQILVQTLPNSHGVFGAPIVVNISNIAVDGSNNGLSGCATDLVGIYYQNASGTVNHVTARYQELDPGDFGCQDGLALYAQSGYGTGTGTVTFENSSVHDYDKNGITADGAGMVATISGNYVVGIGATTLIAQNGIQLSTGASGKISTNTVTDDVYTNPSDCYNSNPSLNTCYSSTGILLFDSGGTSGTPVTISSNTVSNTQGGIVIYTDGSAPADYNTVSSNKVTTTPAIVVTGYTYLLDGIDLCSNHNTATSNTVYYSSGSGVHLDSSCATGMTGNSSSASGTTVNEACAGVLLGNNAGSATTTTSYNVVEVTATGDSCPVGNGGTSVSASGRATPQPKHR